MVACVHLSCLSMSQSPQMYKGFWKDKVHVLLSPNRACESGKCPREVFQKFPWQTWHRRSRAEVAKQGEKARVGEDNLWGPSLIPRGLATLRRGSSGGALQKFVQQHDCHLEDKLTGEKTEAVFQDVWLTEVATKASPCLTITTSHLLTFTQQFYWI